MEFETLTSGYVLLEAPRVDEEGCLYFTDSGLDFTKGGLTQSKGAVFRRSPNGVVETLFARDAVAGLAVNAGGGVVVGGAALVLWNERTGGLRDLFTEWEGKPLFCANDMAIDRQGSIYVGSLGCNVLDEIRMRGVEEVRKTKLPPGSVFRIDPPGVATKLADDIGLPNGMAFGPGDAVLYVADTFSRVIWAFDVTPARELANRRAFAALPADGLAVDVDGAVWATQGKAGGDIIRIMPDGRIDRRIPVPASIVTSLAFGGKDGRDLYITTGDNNEDPALRGTVFRTRMDVAGLPVPAARF